MCVAGLIADAAPPSPPRCGREVLCDAKSSEPAPRPRSHCSSPARPPSTAQRSARPEEPTAPPRACACRRSCACPSGARFLSHRVRAGDGNTDPVRELRRNSGAARYPPLLPCYSTPPAFAVQLPCYCVYYCPSSSRCDSSRSYVEGLGENALFYNFAFFHVFFFGSPGEHILFRPDKVAKNCGQVLILSLKLFQSNENTVSNPRRGKEHDPSPNCIRLGPSQKVYYCSSAWSFQICAAILHAVGHPMRGNFREFPNFWYSDMARGARRGEEAGLCTAELPAHSHEKVTNCCGKMQGQLRSLKLFLAQFF